MPVAHILPPGLFRADASLVHAPQFTRPPLGCALLSASPPRRRAPTPVLGGPAEPPPLRLPPCTCTCIALPPLSPSHTTHATPAHTPRTRMLPLNERVCIQLAVPSCNNTACAERAEGIDRASKFSDQLPVQLPPLGMAQRGRRELAAAGRPRMHVCLIPSLQLGAWKLAFACRAAGWRESDSSIEIVAFPRLLEARTLLSQLPASAEAVAD